MDVLPMFPHLKSCAEDPIRREYDELVNQYDSAARLSVSLALTSVLTSAVLVVRYGWWGLLSLSILVFARLAYLGAVEAATSSGQLLLTMVDLYRFDLLSKLRVPLPTSPDRERQVNQRLANFFSDPKPTAKFPLEEYSHPDSLAGGAEQSRH
jgi:hypothetical protein